jgi:hypothetical protein
MGRLFRVGVRHHSPACARLVDATIRAVRPSIVLVEGPSDMNGRIPELLLDHTPPIALFSFLRTPEGMQRASWYPICGYSPEWVALKVGSEIGSEVRFMDLPSWDDAFDDLVNRSADGVDRYGDAIKMLCARTNTTGHDSLWDHLFEGLANTVELDAALSQYFEELRSVSETTRRDGAREDHMRAHIRAALSHGGDVVVVCGGFHAPALALADAGESGDSGVSGQIPWPEPPHPPVGRAESYLVPYSYDRLDAFTGYQSGMPSPGYYDAVYEHGVDGAVDVLIHKVVKRLRDDRQAVSTADLVAVHAQIQGLARLRAHAMPLRVDVLDGLASGLLKSATDVPFPWDERSILDRRAHPLLLHMVQTFRGDRIGQLDPATPRPPLLADAIAEMEAAGLVAVEEKTVELDRTQAAHRRRSVVLHRLRILEIPGFSRLDSGLTVDEKWTLRPETNRDVALIEASIFGPTLASASTGRLTDRLRTARTSGDSVEAASVLIDALHAELDAMADEALTVAEQVVDADRDLDRLGLSLAVFDLVLAAERLAEANINTAPITKPNAEPKTDTASITQPNAEPKTDTASITQPNAEPITEPAAVIAPANRLAQCAGLARHCVERFVWLLERNDGAAQSNGEGAVSGIITLCQIVRRLPAIPDAVEGVFARQAQDSLCHPAIRGACLGGLWNLNLLGDDAREIAMSALRALPPDQQPGDFLRGLFGVARHQVVADGSVMEALDALVSGWSADHFLTLLPGLRRAFAWFAPRERARLADRIAQLHGLSRGTRLIGVSDIDPIAVAAGMMFDEGVQNRMRAYGLLTGDGNDAGAPDPACRSDESADRSGNEAERSWPDGNDAGAT